MNRSRRIHTALISRQKKDGSFHELGCHDEYFMIRQYPTLMGLRRYYVNKMRYRNDGKPNTWRIQIWSTEESWRKWNKAPDYTFIHTILPPFPHETTTSTTHGSSVQVAERGDRPTDPAPDRGTQWFGRKE